MPALTWILAAARAAAADLKVYPPFTPTRAPMAAPRHALFSAEGVAVWRDDALAFLARAVAR